MKIRTPNNIGITIFKHMYITVAIDADLSVSDAGGTPSSSNSGIIFVYR